MANEILTPRMNEFSNAWEYELLDDCEIDDGGGRTIVVPRFFSYDGASIPSLAWQAIYTPFDPIVMTPALVHDWLYTSHEVAKQAADLVLRRLLERNGVPPVKLELIYRAVEFFGEAAWMNTPDDLEYLRWLQRKLRDAGAPLDRYRFPPELGT